MSVVPAAVAVTNDQTALANSSSGKRPLNGFAAVHYESPKKNKMDAAFASVGMTLL